MHTELFDLDLQLLGGEGGGGAGAAGASSGGEGGEGAGPVATSPADDGQARLEELGVPKDRIRKNRAYKVPTADKAIQPESTQQAAAAEKPETAEQEPAKETNTEAYTQTAKRMTWDEIMKDPEYNKSMQETMQKRLAKSKAAEDKLSKLEPALELIARSHGIDVSDMANLDIDAFVKSVTEDTAFYEDKAAELGIPVETAMKLELLEKNKAKRDAEERQTIEMKKLEQHYRGLVSQGEALKATFPNFNLEQELQNPVFVRMTSPEGGISVEDAYYAVHRKEIQQASIKAAAQTISEKMSSSIASGMRRPMENGSQSKPASVSTMDYRNMSREQRESLKKQIMQASARGEKLYPTR